MRVPGFFNWKYHEPFLVRLIGGTGKRYSRDEILTAFPPIARAEHAPIKGDLPYSVSTEALIREWIEVIPAEKVDHYQDWFALGTALAPLGDDWADAPGRGEDIRFERWETLSGKARADTGCAEKWPEVLRAASQPHKEPATFKSLKHLAKEAGWTWETSRLSPEHIEAAKLALAKAEGRLRPLPGECFDDESASLGNDWRPNGDGEPKSDGRQAGTAGRVTFRRASDITPESISWLWEGWLARGKYHVLAGVPGTGKTTIALFFAAIISSGGKWPDGTQATAGDVLIWTSEDSPADTLVPRLIRVGADLTRIHFVENFNLTDGKIRPFNPATDMRELAKTAKAIGDVALMILDPAVAVMPMSRNSHNDAETRNGMQPVVDFATASNTTLLGIGHLAKGTAGKDPLERLTEVGRLARSRAWSWAPRKIKRSAKGTPSAFL
jgi:AAA domain-containing protein/primase-like protein